MKWFQHNWLDPETIKILRNIRETMILGEKSRLVVLESVMADGEIWLKAMLGKTCRRLGNQNDSGIFNLSLLNGDAWVRNCESWVNHPDFQLRCVSSEYVAVQYFWIIIEDKIIKSLNIKCNLCHKLCKCVMNWSENYIAHKEQQNIISLYQDLTILGIGPWLYWA